MKQILFLFLLTSLTVFTGCKQKHVRSIVYNYSAPIDLLDGVSIAHSSNYQIDTLDLINITKLILSGTIVNIHSLLILKDIHNQQLG